MTGHPKPEVAKRSGNGKVFPKKGNSFPAGTKRTRVRPSPTSRSVAEWIGRTPESEPPPHVVRRIFDAHDGRCHITGKVIDPLRDDWQVEHKRSLRNGGENRESNMGPALVAPHRVKSAIEQSRGAKADRVREKLVLGLHKSRHVIAGSRRHTHKRKVGEPWWNGWERRAP